MTPTPGVIYDIEGYINSDVDVAQKLVHLKLTGLGERVVDTLKIQFILVTPIHGRSLRSARYLSEKNSRIMADESTADLKISCGEKDNKKIFNVHKSFICDSSPVFRAAVETDMAEKRTGEIYIDEVDEGTLQEMIHYVYTGDFTGADLNVQMVAWLADKYVIPGMVELLCARMRENADSDSGYVYCCR